ncbi:hypothetical protein [Candidatus Ruminimicrobium bovinum]|uniref:hypothetical protein n=1 Tax=Candidatus Ruminimicrobium bovinum TaxID=3242779 RepID=UPI0039B97D00
MFSRATSGISYSENSSITLLLGKILQSISYFAVIFSFINKKLNKKGSIFVFISSLSLLISFFPTSLARNTTGVIYLGLLLTLSKTLKTNKLFIILFLGAFLILFPFLNAFRNISFYNVSITQSILNVFNNLSIVWLAGDYDAYTMLNLVIDYIHINSITFGYQLLGVVLFFIPRIFWMSKPIGSGAFIAENYNWNFTNVSCPLPAESLINFGFIGLIIFGILIGFIAKKLDLFYWENIDISGKQINNFELIYPVILMFFFFMCRGDLLSSTAYMMAYIFVWFILIKILNINILQLKKYNKK